MRNSTLVSATFAQWLASGGPKPDASPNLEGDDFEYRPIAAASMDHERLAMLANEILTAAIKLAAVLEVAQRSDGRSCRSSLPQKTGVYVDE